MNEVDVIVLGGGPVGETMLVQLAHRGIRAIGFERDADIWPKPRAVHFDGEVFRSFQPTGLADAIAAACVPMRDYRMENEAGEILLDTPTDQIGVHGWIASSMFNQPEIDALLRAEIDRSDTTELRTGHEVVGITQTDDSVTATVRDASGHEYQVTAAYLVACDGATSTTRHIVGAQWDTLGPDDQWLVADGELVAEAPVAGSMVFFGHHSRPHIWAAMPGGRARMEFKILPGDDPDELATTEGVTRLSGGLLTPENFRLVRTAVYTFRSRVATPWRTGRVFLAGDAAHLTPPLFGQGLCSGMRDVANLLWKLDLVLGGAPESLLDTYESERSAHTQAWIAQATELSRLVQTTDPAVAAGRDAHIRAHPEDGQPISPSLGDGLHAGVGPAGAPAPQPILADGRRFDDVLGPDFAVVAGRELLDALPDSVRTAAAQSSRITLHSEDTPGFDEFLRALRDIDPNTVAAVVRPDRYLLGTAHGVAELEAQIAMAIGACSTLDEPARA
ncbi:bifunctional 3-(3-hydroxy-phenyl)propionate/3-hydroxycinnamic acid hydroxylase [Gordonia sp. CPCC 205515]|uniref:bifunctional 3-(3-hydroxy-phenyl)propionate/3-hydroxycinnamic acid hydroxylase n=1 Tax=Gordonia sp. CPCC 205515 TaxID=3140791 RepID=UPI003AF3C6F5